MTSFGVEALAKSGSDGGGHGRGRGRSGEMRADRGRMDNMNMRRMSMRQAEGRMAERRENRGSENEIRVSAETFANVSEAKVKVNFATDATDSAAIVQETLDRIRLSRNDIARLLTIKNEAEEIDNFRAVLSGAEEVPAIATTSASGTTNLNLQMNDTELRFNVMVSNITDATAAHIHQGVMGVNGPIVANLFTGPTKTGLFSGVLAEGVIRASDLTGPLAGQPLSSLIDLLRNGGAYINVHTVNNPNGEIRGQVMAQLPVIKEKLRVRAGVVENNATKVKAEFTFAVASTSREAIIDGIFSRLSLITAGNILDALELKLDVRRNDEDRRGSNRGRR